MAEETRKEAVQTGSTARFAARVTFYLGIFSLLVGITLRFIWTGAPAFIPSPHTFILMTLVWFVMAIAILLAEVERKLGEK